MPCVTGQHRTRSLLQLQCIEWLDDPTFGSTTAGEMDVGCTVEEHDHGHVWDAVVAVVEAQVHRYCHGAHGAELQVEDREIGSAATNGLGYIAAIATDSE